MRALAILSLLLAGAASACTSTTEGSVDFAVSGGFAGNGDGTTPLHIEPDGTLLRTRPTHNELSVLDPAVTADLYDKIANARFATLDPMYPACCDDYVYVVTVEVGGSLYVVQAHTLAKIPDRLQAVIDALTGIANEE
jgi:hypothetical protein